MTLAHVSIMKVLSFELMCGGLPAPECADNPLKYKFRYDTQCLYGAHECCKVFQCFILKWNKMYCVVVSLVGKFH